MGAFRGRGRQNLRGPGARRDAEFDLGLYDSAGFRLAAAYGKEAPILFFPASGGAFYLKAASDDRAGDGSYSLSLIVDSLQSGFPVRFSSPDFEVPLHAGAAYDVAWAADSIPSGYVTLGLFRGDIRICNLKVGIANNGYTSVIMPANLEPGGDYRLRLTWFGMEIRYGYGPTFSIADPADPGGAGEGLPGQRR